MKAKEDRALGMEEACRHGCGRLVQLYSERTAQVGKNQGKIKREK